MVLVWLDKIEVRAFAFRETVLTIEEKFGAYDGILTPAMHVKRGLGKYESTGIRDTRVLDLERARNLASHWLPDMG